MAVGEIKNLLHTIPLLIFLLIAMVITIDQYIESKRIDKTLLEWFGE